MGPRLRRALRAGLTATVGLLVLQATAAVALAAALPEVGHVHPDGADPHVHALVEVGGLGAAIPVAAPTPRPALAGRAARPRGPRGAPRPRPGRAGLGRDPPWSRAGGAPLARAPLARAPLA